MTELTEVPLSRFLSQNTPRRLVTATSTVSELSMTCLSNLEAKMAIQLPLEPSIMATTLESPRATGRGTYQSSLIDLSTMVTTPTLERRVGRRTYYLLLLEGIPISLILLVMSTSLSLLLD